jgi:hypothetical protein
VASNWQLVGGVSPRIASRFQRSMVLVLFYVIVLVPDFSARKTGSDRAFLAFIPMQGISFFSSGFRVGRRVGKRNPVTLRMEWKN